MYQHLYRYFLDACPGELHFAAHSHHWWPDVTRDAQLACWDDAARWRDRKWDHLFAERIPRLQQLLAGLLGSTTPQQLVFAPNTHEFVLRLLSCLPEDRSLRVLTTRSEFHSFERQMHRLEETGRYQVKRLPSEPINDLAKRLQQQLHNWRPDLLFVSQVFFDSGLVLTELTEIVAAAPPETLVVIDGYHGFCALPQDLSPILDRAFYLAGGYKYAQSGEGCCFLHVPPKCPYRPRNTGWFANFDSLDEAAGEIAYARDGRRFAGATFDPSGLYRLQAVLELFQSEGLSIAGIHAYVTGLQQHFLQQLTELRQPRLSPDRLILAPDRPHGHFFSFRLDASEATDIQHHLQRHRITVDRRGDRLRIGFGLYHTTADIDRLIRCLAS